MPARMSATASAWLSTFSPEAVVSLRLLVLDERTPSFDVLFTVEKGARVPLDPDFRRYPTGATLVVDFQIDNWADLRPGEGSVLDFVRLDGR